MKYYQPTSLEEFHQLRSKLHGLLVSVLAGGTDLIPRYERGVSLPDHLIDLKNIATLNRIKAGDNQIEIGALTCIQDLHDHPLIKSEFLALHQAAREFAGPQIRHRGTIGGNICNASPAADLLPPLYAFNAEVTLTSSHGERRLAIHEFILGPGQTALEGGELLTAIIMQHNPGRSQFQKVGLRQSMAIAVVSLACVWEENEQGLAKLNIAVGAVAPTVKTLTAFSSAYLAEPKNLPELMPLIDEAISPVDDIRASANYRRKVLKNLIREFLSR